MQTAENSLQAGIRLINENQLEAAYTQLAQALQDFPDDSRVLLQLTKLALLGGMPDEAENFLREAVHVNPDWAGHVLALQAELAAAGQLAAEQALQSMLARVHSTSFTPSHRNPPPYRLTFCIGAPRSGTTVVGSLLTEGDEAFPMLPECSFMTQLIAQFDNILRYADKPRFETYAKSPEALAQAFRPALEGLIDNAQSHFSGLTATHLVLKDPELSIYVDHLPLFFKDFKVVCVVRDPRDVIASLIRVDAKGGRQRSINELIAYAQNYYTVPRYSSVMSAGHLHCVSFEKIMHKDEDEFARLEEFLGYAVGRQGFGKVFFDFDRPEQNRSDPTFSQNYGKPLMVLSEERSDIGEEGLAKIEAGFGILNKHYHWW